MQNVQRAIHLLCSLLNDAVSSSIYSTPSVSIGDSSVYCNAVIAGWSSLSPEELSGRLKEVESDFGRIHDKKSPCVELDLDVVIADSEILRPRDYDRQYFRIGYMQLIDKED